MKLQSVQSLLTPHEHGESGEQRVESPVLCEVRDDDGPDGLGGEHGAPGGRHHALLRAHPDRRTEVLKLRVRDVPKCVSCRFELFVYRVVHLFR